MGERGKRLERGEQSSRRENRLRREREKESERDRVELPGMNDEFGRKNPRLAGWVKASQPERVKVVGSVRDEELRLKRRGAEADDDERRCCYCC